MSAQRRITAVALDRLRGQLSDRDTDVLVSINTYRLMRVHHIQRLHFTGHTSGDSANRICRRVLQRLTDQQLIARLERRIGGARAGSSGNIYTLTPLGHRLLGSVSRRRHSEPSKGFVGHTLAIAELATSLIERCWNSISGITSWQIETEPTAWRTFTGHMHNLVLKPDLGVRLTNDDYELRWFVEMDMGTESGPTIQRKCQTYTDYWRSGSEQHKHDIFPRVLWIVPDDNRARQIDSAIHSGSGMESSLFSICTVHQAVDFLTDFEGDEP